MPELWGGLVLLGDGADRDAGLSCGHRLCDERPQRRPGLPCRKLLRDCRPLGGDGLMLIRLLLVSLGNRVFELRRGVLSRQRDSIGVFEVRDGFVLSLDRPKRSNHMPCGESLCRLWTFDGDWLMCCGDLLGDFSDCVYELCGGTKSTQYGPVELRELRSWFIVCEYRSQCNDRVPCW